jgi:hypothetical protein
MRLNVSERTGPVTLSICCRRAALAAWLACVPLVSPVTAQKAPPVPQAPALQPATPQPRGDLAAMPTAETPLTCGTQDIKDYKATIRPGHHDAQPAVKVVFERAAVPTATVAERVLKACAAAAAKTYMFSDELVLVAWHHKPGGDASTDRVVPLSDGSVGLSYDPATSRVMTSEQKSRGRGAK